MAADQAVHARCLSGRLAIAASTGETSTRERRPASRGHELPPRMSHTSNTPTFRNDKSGVKLCRQAVSAESAGAVTCSLSVPEVWLQSWPPGRGEPCSRSHELHGWLAVARLRHRPRCQNQWPTPLALLRRLRRRWHIWASGERGDRTASACTTVLPTAGDMGTRAQICLSRKA